MTAILEKQIGLSADQSNLQNAIFILDFDSDCMSMVCTTSSGQTVSQTIQDLIYRAINNDKRIAPKTAKAIRNSKYIDVTIEGYNLSETMLIVRKYELIEQYHTYSPLGHNFLHNERSSKLARWLAQDLAKKLKLDGNIPLKAPQDRRGRPGIPIFQYCKIEGTTPEIWYLEKKWPSLKAVIDEHPAWSAGNISRACNCIDAEAYNFKWSHSEIPNFINEQPVIELYDEK